MTSKTGTKNNITNRLSDIEWTCLWMSVRYSMNRQTAAASAFPQGIIENYYHRLSANQKQSIVRDLKSNEDDWAFSGKAFGHEEIDRPHWIKLWKALDVDCHYEVELIDKTKCTVFDANGKVVPLHKYIEDPYCNYFIPIENIMVGDANS